MIGWDSAAADCAIDGLAALCAETRGAVPLTVNAAASYSARSDVQLNLARPLAGHLPPDSPRRHPLGVPEPQSQSSLGVGHAGGVVAGPELATGGRSSQPE